MEDDNSVKKRELDENIETSNKKICSRDDDDITNKPSTSGSSEAGPSTSGSSQAGPSTSESSEAGPSTSESSEAGPSTSSSDQGGTTFADEFYLGGTFCDFKYRNKDSDDSDDDDDINNFDIDNIGKDDITYHEATIIGTDYYYNDEFDTIVKLVSQSVEDSTTFLTDHHHNDDDDDDELWEPMPNFDEPNKESTSDPLTAAEELWEKDPMIDPMCNLIDEMINDESKI
ncbi:testis-specific Y-encoded-like protein 2 [Aphidius gifuensis]|uniref:testis-specific Y-encoded-like protein 2 n=1 Tax=Aphidius gifuensis TaxID=684658 RepID=UPI001CDD64C4|nr:testis-specific Y-encoded-like protein 2 [Aphidius gifuensis]